MDRLIEPRKRLLASKVALAALLMCSSFASLQAAPPSKIRDPFERPEPPPKEPGRTIHKGSPRIPSGADSRPDRPEPKPPKLPGKVAAASPMATLDNLQLLYTEWLKVTYGPLWRPTVVFVADQVSAYAMEEAAKTFADMTFTYLSGRGWTVRASAAVAPKLISGAFFVLDVMWPTDIGVEPTPAELDQAVKRLEEQRRKESLPETRKRPADQLPEKFRDPASLEPPINVSTEESRRRAIFADPNLSREQARELLAKGAGIVHGPVAARFMESFLWLFDADRINREGLSEEAEVIFEEIVGTAQQIQKRRKKKLFHNACLIAPPNWEGIPARWTCSLPATQDYASCYCPPPPNIVGSWIMGYPTRMDTGQACVIPKAGVCPLTSSSPLAGFCACPEFPGLLGQVRR